MLLSQYLLESSFCLLVFYGFYHFWLRKETFFQLNRAYLLATPTVSMLIPWLDISLRQSLEKGEITYLYPILDNADQVQFFIGEKLNEPTPAFTLSLGELVLGIYLIGALFMLSKLILSLFSIFKLIKNHNKKKLNEENIILTNQKIPSSSFFSFIFWNSAESTDNQRLILEHEKVHVRQWHSLDVLWMELLVILKWFNPLIYLFRNALRVTHEFIADAYILKEIAPVNEYATALVVEAKKNLRRNAPSVLSHTFASLVKQRLNKMIQPKSSGWKAGKYVFVFPLALSLMVLFSFNCSDQLPGGKQVGELSEYLDDLGDKTVYESSQNSNNYLMWGGERFKTLHYKDDGTDSKKNNMRLPDLEKVIDEDLQLFIRGKERKIEEILIGYEHENGCTVCNISEANNLKACAKHLNANSKEEMQLLIVFKTTDGELCQSLFTIGFPGKSNIFDCPDFNNTLNEFVNFAIPVSNIDLKRGVFKSKNNYENYARWGKNEFDLGISHSPHGGIIGSNYNLTIDEFKKLANQKLSIHVQGKDYTLSTLKFLSARNPPSTERNTEFKQHSESIYKDFFTVEAVNQIASFAEDGYTFISINFTYLNEFRQEKAVNLGLNLLNPATENWKDLLAKGIQVNRPIANFQLINRRDQQTIIKMDTTSKKYRWMYENYRDGGNVKVVHIPNFKTITRVVTLADEIVAEAEIAESYQLIDAPKNALIYPEFHELLNANVHFSWRDMIGVFDDKVNYLETFQKSSQIEPKLIVDGQTYKLIQFEILSVPVDSPPVRFVTDSANKSAINRFIEDMELRTSLYISNILIEDEKGEVVLFPLRFAFNLM